MPKHHNPERFRNPSDIHDTTTWEQSEAEAQREYLAKSIRMHVDLDSLEPAQRACVALWKDETLGTLQKWSDAMDILLSDPAVSPRIREYLKEHRMELPLYDLYDSAEGNSLLEPLGYELVKPENFLVVFELPKPLHQFWWKNNTEEKYWQSGDRKLATIEWGRMYRAMMPIIWEANEQSRSHRQRINPCGVHKVREYYYLWELSATPSNFGEE